MNQTIAQKYPLLYAMTQNELPEQVTKVAQRLTEKYPVLHPQRAKDLAAAYLAELMFSEWGRLEMEVENAEEVNDETRFYDAASELSLAGALTEASGTRSLFDDLSRIKAMQTARGILWSDAVYRMAEEEVKA